jgi:S-adenosylmethionine-diacylglycerol 3-amino-3-carboxypropyl transferase
MPLLTARSTRSPRSTRAAQSTRFTRRGALDAIAANHRDRYDGGMTPTRLEPSAAHGDAGRGADRIADRARFDFVRYANGWEDAEVLVAALRPRPGARILGIAAAGDNCLSLVAAGAEVVAVDLSPAQLALAELKRTAIRRLPYEELLAFLGVQPAAGDRLATLAGLAGELSPSAREYWRQNTAAVAGGVIHCGKFERYFGLFRRRILPLVHGRRSIAALLAPRDAGGREEFYRRRWDTWRWRLLFRLFFSRRAMGRLGRDPEFFRYVEGSVAERILGRARYALTALPTGDNPYLRYILTGGFDAAALPHYLRPEVCARLRERLEREPQALALHLGAVDEVAAALVAGGGAPFDGFNLSDIFEYLDPPTCARIFRALLAAARPGARLAYWNMLVPRSCPSPEPAASADAAAARRVRPLAAEAAELFARDRAFFYSAFVLEEVC